jgi:small subunit ribosomal protein S20
MPIIKSAKKRVRTNAKAKIRNSKAKRNMRDSIKSFNKKPSVKSLSQAQSDIDKALKKNIIHKNKAARLKKRASALAKQNGVKTIKKTVTKKSTVKKTAPKKVLAK